MGKRVWIHLLAWVLLSVAHFFLSEPLVRLMFPDTHGVMLWSITVVSGLIAIFVLVVVSLTVSIVRYRSNKRIRGEKTPRISA